MQSIQLYVKIGLKSFSYEFPDVCVCVIKIMKKGRSAFSASNALFIILEVKFKIKSFTINFVLKAISIIYTYKHTK